MDFAEDTGGATAIEYALVGTLISIIIVSALTTMGTKLSSTFASLATSLR